MFIPRIIESQLIQIIITWVSQVVNFTNVSNTVYTINNIAGTGFIYFDVQTGAVRYINGNPADYPTLNQFPYIIITNNLPRVFVDQYIQSRGHINLHTAMTLVRKAVHSKFSQYNQISKELGFTE